jgi:hypothetical protein
VNCDLNTNWHLNKNYTKFIVCGINALCSSHIIHPRKLKHNPGELKHLNPDELKHHNPDELKHHNPDELNIS